MKRLLILSLAVGSGIAIGRLLDGLPPTAAAGGGQGGGLETCTAENGDVNADGNVNLSDALALLKSLFSLHAPPLPPLCETQCPPSGLPDTGQTLCYDESGSGVPIACDPVTCPGQDGFYQTGCPMEVRFVDNGDGTVSDNCTGLMWQKDTGNDGNPLIWCDALTYCETLSFAGHDDWRLPNVRELQSIVDYGRWNPSIDPAFSVLLERYWSSTTYQNSHLAWFVNFAVGVSNGDSKPGRGESFYVRAVRGRL